MNIRTFDNVYKEVRNEVNTEKNVLHLLLTTTPPQSWSESNTGNIFIAQLY